MQKRISPGPRINSDEEILQFIRNTGQITQHMVGTCKMGRDAMSVVDERLRVHGIKGLRIADASGHADHHIREHERAVHDDRREVRGIWSWRILDSQIKLARAGAPARRWQACRCKGLDYV
ncbi:GMC oxidoreductase [Cupriavidus basilensis]